MMGFSQFIPYFLLAPFMIVPFSTLHLFLSFPFLRLDFLRCTLSQDASSRVCQCSERERKVYKNLREIENGDASSICFLLCSLIARVHVCSVIVGNSADFFLYVAWYLPSGPPYLSPAYLAFAFLNSLDNESASVPVQPGAISRTALAIVSAAVSSHFKSLYIWWRAE
jgi:hypothetical protein